MTKEQLIEYVNLYNQFQNNPNMQFTNIELNIINRVQQEANNNPLLGQFLENIKNVNEIERINLLNAYLNEEELKKQGEKEEEVIASTYGIDISKIEHKYLENGKEIFYFYDMKLGRNVILENKKEGITLVEQLKKMQAQNQKFQTGTDEQNTNEMLNEQQNKENIEMKLISLNELQNHMNEIQNMSIEEAQKLNFLIRNSDQLRINYINIENLVGIDIYGKLLEVRYDKENNRYMINEPMSANYDEEQINTSDRIDENYTASEQYNSLQSDYEDKPEITPQEEYEALSDQVKEQIQKYYEYPELLEMLPEEERAKWQRYIDIYTKIKEQEQIQKEQNKPKQKIYKKEEQKAGFADVLLLSLITGFLAGVLTTLTMIIIQK